MVKPVITLKIIDKGYSKLGFSRAMLYFDDEHILMFLKSCPQLFNL